MMSRLVPKLRFEEFSGEWEEKQIGDFFTAFSGGTPSSTNKNYYGGNIPFIRSAEINKEKTELFLTKKGLDNSSAKYVNKGDVLYALYGANSGDVGVSRIKGAINQAILCLHSKESNHKFLFYYLTKEKKNIIDKYIQGGQGNLSGNIVKSISIYLPTPKEQKKIANTLSSLDNLIEAQSKKVEVLKKHKKGLMQKLFPKDGERLPEFRFEGFLGDWEEIKLGSIGKVSMCKRILKDQTTIYGDIPFYKIGTFGKEADAYISKEIYEKYKNKYSFPKKGDILISASGTIGRLVVYNGINAYFQDSNIVWIDNNEIIIKNSFLYFCYKNVKWNTDNNTIARLYNDNLRSMKIKIPKLTEQKKIAQTLSSLDNLIEAQSKKIETLKAHKKGLMQQMFVSGEG